MSILFFKSYFIFKNFTHMQNVFYFIYNILCPFYLPQDMTTCFLSTVLSIYIIINHYYYYYHYFIISLSPLGTGHVHMAVELSLGYRKPTNNHILREKEHFFSSYLLHNSGVRSQILLIFFK